MTRHLLTGAELSRDEIHALLERALEMKAAPTAARPLEGRSVALIFQKPSTRTRVSFEAGIFELGGHALGAGSDEHRHATGIEQREEVARRRRRGAVGAGHAELQRAHTTMFTMRPGTTIIFLTAFPSRAAATFASASTVPSTVA